MEMTPIDAATGRVVSPPETIVLNKRLAAQSGGAAAVGPPKTDLLRKLADANKAAAAAPSPPLTLTAGGAEPMGTPSAAAPAAASETRGAASSSVSSSMPDVSKQAKDVRRNRRFGVDPTKEQADRTLGETPLWESGLAAGGVGVGIGIFAALWITSRKRDRVIIPHVYTLAKTFVERDSKIGKVLVKPLQLSTDVVGTTTDTHASFYFKVEGAGRAGKVRVQAVRQFVHFTDPEEIARAPRPKGLAVELPGKFTDWRFSELSVDVLGQPGKLNVDVPPEMQA
jgi:hypothetical protein